MPRILLAVLLAAGLCLAHAAQAAGAGHADARHFLERTGLGASEAQVEAWAALSRREMVERGLANGPAVAQTPPPAWAGAWTPLRERRGLSDEEKKRLQREQLRQGLELRAWWVREMLDTPAPQLERMTLFWHNHFTSSLQKVKSASLMHAQNVMLRRHAMGSFAALLHAAARDPAMLIYLDSASSRRGQPNENFAREVMELFTLGEGQYTEQDVREAARAFTGWSIDPDTGGFLWRPFAHDGGEKSVLGRRGNFRGEDVIELLLAQPATAEFITAKLWREFISPSPDPLEVRRIAAVFRSGGYDIRAALSALWGSEAFWAAQNRAALIKSPVDLVLGTARGQAGADREAPALALLLRRLGQDLFAPPNVRGWPGGEAWVNASTLMARKQFLERVAGDGRGMARAELHVPLLDPAYQLK